MSYRVCCVTHIAYDQVSTAMLRQAQAHSSSFDALQHHYTEQGFIYSDSLAHAMRAIGNESMQILYNLEVLQKLWAAENGVSYGQDTWPQEIALAQIKAYRPEVIVIQGLHRDPRFTLVPTQEFRDQCPFVKLIVATSGFVMEPEVARHVDIVVANAPVLYEHYRNAGAAVELVYHAFDGRVPEQVAAYQRGHPDAELYDFTFTGSTGYGWGEGHKSRYYDLVHLLAATGLKLWGYERVQDRSLSSPLALAHASASMRPLMWRLSATEFVDFIQNLTKTLFGSDVPALPLTTIFPERCQGALFGIPMYDVIARSRLSFNRHTDTAGRDVGNIRMFHATGLGSCLISDTGQNIRDLFEPDSEIVVYSSAEECVEKVRYLLSNEVDRKSIAEAGMRRTLRDHTYARRAEKLDLTITRGLQRRIALPKSKIAADSVGLIAERPPGANLNDRLTYLQEEVEEVRERRSPP